MPGLGTRRLRLYVGATEYTSAVSDVRITTDKLDSDFMSFADAAAGGARQYTLKLTMKQDTDAAALWYQLWSATGTDVAVTVWPNGQNTTNPTTPTTTYPKVTGTVTIKESDGADILGGEANDSTTAVFTTDAEFPFLAKPLLATA